MKLVLALTLAGAVAGCASTRTPVAKTQLTSAELPAVETEEIPKVGEAHSASDKIPEKAVDDKAADDKAEPRCAEHRRGGGFSGYK